MLLGRTGNWQRSGRRDPLRFIGIQSCSCLSYLFIHVDVLWRSENLLQIQQNCATFVVKFDFCLNKKRRFSVTYFFFSFSAITAFENRCC